MFGRVGFVFGVSGGKQLVNTFQVCLTVILTVKALIRPSELT